MTLFRHVVIWIFISILTLVVVKTSLARMWEDSRPSAALKLRPNHTEALIAQNRIWLQSTQSDSTTNVQRNVEAILKQAPLNDDALLHLALIQNGRSSSLNSGDLLLKARERNARNRGTLRRLIQHYTRLGNVKNTIPLVDLLFRLDPDNFDAYRRALYGFYGADEGRDAINEALKSGPQWGYHILKLKLKEITKDEIVSFSGPVNTYLAATAPSRATEDLQRDYLMRLMTFGQDDFAYTQWSKWAPADERQTFEASSNKIFNPTIKPSTSVFPFNWYFYNDEITLIDHEPHGGVFISSALKEPRLILRQYVKVGSQTPTRLTTQSNITTQSKDQSLFQWTALCAKDRTVIATSLITDSASSAPKGQHTFVIPATDCEYLDLQLWGKPALYKNRITMLLEQVSLTVEAQ